MRKKGTASGKSRGEAWEGCPEFAGRAVSVSVQDKYPKRDACCYQGSLVTVPVTECPATISKGRQ